MPGREITTECEFFVSDGSTPLPVDACCCFTVWDPGSACAWFPAGTVLDVGWECNICHDITPYQICEPYDMDMWGMVTVTAWPNMPVVVLGEGFPEGEWVYLTLCGDGYSEEWGDVMVLPCGTFIWEDYILYTVPYGPVSVKAWLGGYFEGEVQACWPLYIYGID